MIYRMAAALDPCNGFVWLDGDHPGDDAVKRDLRHKQMHFSRRLKPHENITVASEVCGGEYRGGKGTT